MAAPSTLLSSFHSFVNCKESLVISDNNDLAICTDDGFYILEHRYGVNLTNSDHHFTKCFISCSRHINILQDSISLQKADKHLNNEELQLAILDRTIIPTVASQASRKGFCCAAWSPRDAGNHKRCLLAGLSHDHRLNIYISHERSHYELLTELSKKFYEYCEENNSGVHTNYTTLKENTYRTAAVEIAWSSTIELESNKLERFSLLAVAMKNGDIVFWKAVHPLVSRDGFSVDKVVSTGSSIPSALCWLTSNSTSNSVYLAVGYQNGIVTVICINMNDHQNSLITQTMLHADEDIISVASLCWRTTPSSNPILIIAKGEFVLVYVVELQSSSVVLKDTSHTQGPHTLETTALSCRNGEIVLSSADGGSSRVKVDISNGLRMQIKPVSGIKHKYNIKWTCHGGCITTNGIYYISIYSPSAFYDHLKNKFPLSVHILPLKDIQPSELPTLLSSHKVDLYHGGDIYDIVRRNLHLEFSATEKTYKDYKTIYKNYLDKQPTSVLQAWRFILMIILTVAPEKKDEEFDDSEIPEKCEIVKEMKKITCLIITHHIHKTFDKSKDEQLHDKDILVLQMMLKWLRVNQPDFTSLIAGIEKLTKTSKNITQLDNCFICDQKYSILLTKVECPNGHNFGLCCQTLQICSELPFLCCMVCGVTAFSINKLQEYNCLPEHIMRCSLCCSPLS